MKTFSALFISLALLVTLTATSSCKKKNETNKCDGISNGGIISYHPTYKFYTRLMMYNTSIELKDNLGAVVDTKIMSGYLNTTDPRVQPDACTIENGTASFTLYNRGTTYTYTATNGTNKWTGAIEAPCDPVQCYIVEIK